MEQARASRGDDRLDVFRCATSLAIVVAGLLATDAVVLFVRAPLLADENIELADLLARADRAVLAQASGGDDGGRDRDERTCVHGASVGDSEAWVVGPGARAHVRSAAQPLLGSGSAAPVAFRQESLAGTLVVGTDGLFEYASETRIAAIVAETELAELPARLMDLVRLPSGALQDDSGRARLGTSPQRI